MNQPTSKMNPPGMVWDPIANGPMRGAYVELQGPPAPCLRHDELLAAVNHPNFSHATSRDLMPTTILLYRRDSKSPSGVLCMDAAGDLHCEMCNAIVNTASSIHHGPTRGAIAEGWRR